MRKYVELGIGNRWLLRTEIEQADGTETEVRGWQRPFRVRSGYIRVWLGYRVIVLDTRDGLKRSRKTRRGFKLLLGLTGE
ncbi:DUF3977 family protein [Gorillibacterium sp. sgz500922]|uniref:DUF3977 family protein n=1 Tax=Gorillibacterium sp. sgz500922 TaxID=3446694 RepID=UPI003F676A96